jgi:hypothetical protein
MSVVRELMRHVDATATISVYTQAITSRSRTLKVVWGDALFGRREKLRREPKSALNVSSASLARKLLAAK